MPERRGDKDIIERVNEGEAELLDFFPGGARSDRDMVTVLSQSAMRQSIYFDKRLRPAHTDSNREGEIPRYLLEAANVPNYVISEPIKVDGRRWEYRVPIEPKNPNISMRRVFIEKDQTIQLAVDVTLDWLSAGKGSPRYESMKKLLEEEVSIPGNEVITQLMYRRIKSNPSKPLIDGNYTAVPI